MYSLGFLKSNLEPEKSTLGPTGLLQECIKTLARRLIFEPRPFTLQPEKLIVEPDDSAFQKFLSYQFKSSIRRLKARARRFYS